MRKVCMCDFCNYIGAEADVKAHETICPENPSVQNCYNCAYAYERSWINGMGSQLISKWVFVLHFYRTARIKHDIFSSKRTA